MSKGPKQTNTVTYAQTPVTSQQQQLASMVQQGSDPTIPFAFAKRREDVNNSFFNPLGAYTTPAVRDASSRVANERMSMEENNAIQASNAQNSQQAFNRQATVADMTRPVQTGGTSYTQPGWGSAVAAGAQMGVSLL